MIYNRLRILLNIERMANEQCTEMQEKALTMAYNAVARNRKALTPEIGVPPFLARPYLPFDTKPAIPI